MVRFTILILVGILMGIFTMLTGGGAGAAYVSILTIFFNVSPEIAVTTSLATMFPTAVVSSFIHARNSTINYRIGWIMLGWGIIGTLIGSYYSRDIPVKYYNTLIGVVILLLTLLMIIKKRKPAPQKEKQVKSRSLQFFQAGFFGVISGILSGFVGTSGTTSIITGLVLLGCSTLQTVGTTVFVLSGLSLTGFLLRVGYGTVNWQLTSILVGSAVIGAFLGMLLLKKVIIKDSTSSDNKVIDTLIIVGNLAIGIASILK